jgi:hypothetical protein
LHHVHHTGIYGNGDWPMSHRYGSLHVQFSVKCKSLLGFWQWYPQCIHVGIYVEWGSSIFNRPCVGRDACQYLDLHIHVTGLFSAQQLSIIASQALHSYLTWTVPVNREVSHQYENDNDDEHVITLWVRASKSWRHLAPFRSWFCWFASICGYFPLANAIPFDYLNNWWRVRYRYRIRTGAMWCKHQTAYILSGKKLAPTGTVFWTPCRLFC